MKVAGTIVEFNPFHAGHAHFLHQIQKEKPSLLVVITTTWFSQRALPSLINPTQKTYLALLNGADLVLELPVIYGSQSADHFARCAIQSLYSSGVTDLYFGSESNDLSFLEKVAAEWSDDHKDPSQSLVRSLQSFVKKHFGKELKSNDLLAVQYIRYCKEFGITPHCIQRNPSFSSATYLRSQLENEKFWTYRTLYQGVQEWESYYPYLRYALSFSSAFEISRFFLIREGIEHRLIRAARDCESWPEFLETALSKGYSRARICRSCLFILLQIQAKVLSEHPDFYYVCILGMNEKGRSYLRTLPSGIKISRASQMPSYLYQSQQKAQRIYEWISQTKQKRELILF